MFKVPKPRKLYIENHQQIRRKNPTRSSQPDSSGCVVRCQRRIRRTLRPGGRCWGWGRVLRSWIGVAPWLRRRIFPRRIFRGGFCGGVLILPCLTLVQTMQSYALSTMPTIRFLETLLAWLMRGFKRPSAIKHQTWLVSYLGYRGSYPMDYAMVMFQTSVCLASVLCHVSNTR